ncbi:3-oxoacyl-[acyl-carrier-protein] synthase II [Deinobacterium chartae]|uniref:3-oxoacyl-[acyl-carrier-protein] synthase 2 n=1 Tax=Deinobacterium chartae TaxID=521158 RepID=A0A841I6L9_9DEIO|nr:beta-ketoacyl-ACP synthase II [Deinobacterium chartae]MBB6099542.1 3-oxoacyl-[acyl-carrier-protein] synthase II [Deinobacterium chartae]
MPEHARRVVITGLGPVTPIGVGAEVFHRAQLEGRSGIRPITRFDTSDFPVRIAGEVDADLSSLDPKERKRLDRFAQLALLAAELALQDADLDPATLDPERVGALIGSSVGGMETYEQQARVAFERGYTRVSPFLIPMMMPNAATSRVAIRYGLQGPSSASATACTTGADAIGGALRMIQHGEADVMLTGGADVLLTPMILGAFGVMKALSTRNDDPTRASRPFDRGRDGFVLAEGAGVLILEELGHARARGARIYAELSGFGRSTDAHHITEPHPEGRGASQAMRRALADARLEPHQVGYVNAHGTSTPLGDRAEVLALERVFGEHAPRLAVSSTKSMTGHGLGASGAIEAIATVQALHSGVLPPSINLEDPDPDFRVDLVANHARPQQVEAALSNAFAFGGLNAALLFERYREEPREVNGADP